MEGTVVCVHRATDFKDFINFPLPVWSIDKNNGNRIFGVYLSLVVSSNFLFFEWEPH